MDVLNGEAPTGIGQTTTPAGEPAGVVPDVDARVDAYAFGSNGGSIVRSSEPDSPPSASATIT